MPRVALAPPPPPPFLLDPFKSPKSDALPRVFIVTKSITLFPGDPPANTPLVEFAHAPESPRATVRSPKATEFPV